MDVDEFSEWLVDQMEKRHLNCLQLSKLTGLIHPTIAYYITGTRSPKLDTLKLILDAFNMHVEIKEN